MNKWVEGSEITDPKEVAEFVFSELKESGESEDERIRKALIQYIKYNVSVISGWRKEELIAWLEKQKDHEDELEKAYKTADEVQYRRGYEAAKHEFEKQGEQKPAFCHHEVDFSGCSEEYRKAYYDGWNNCNQQHAQLEAQQRPTWSEKDEKTFNTVIEKGDLKPSEIDWLKSLKQRLNML